MPQRLRLIAPTTAYPTVDPRAVTSVEEVLEALQKAFRPSTLAHSEVRPDTAQRQDDVGEAVGLANAGHG